MKAVVIQRTGPEPEIGVGEWPDPRPGPGEVVVALRAAALNRNDLMVARDPAVRAPAVIGSDGAGVVAAVGDGVSGPREGDEVVILPSLHWGDDERAHGPAFEILGHPTQGTHAEAVVVPAANVFPRPARLSWEEAAALPLAGVTAWRALRTRAGARAGDTVLVTGASGGVATFLVQIAAGLGMRVLVTSSDPQAIARAHELGAAAGADRTDPEWPAHIRRLAPGGVDAVLDSSGADWPAAMSTLRPGGRLVSFGRTATRQAQIDVGRLFNGQFDVLGTLMGSPAEFAALLAHVEQATWAPVVDSVFALDEAPAAYARMDDPSRFGKVVIAMG